MSASAEDVSAARRRQWLRALRASLLVLGVTMLVVLIRGVGATRVLEVVLGASAMMPIIIACDLGFFACEALAHRAVLGPDRGAIPTARFIRSSLLYYSVLAIAPLGRAGAEIARATSFAPWVGGGRATAAAANIQGSVLIANMVISLPAWLAVISTVGPSHPLAWLLVINGVGTGLFGIVTLLVVRRSRVGERLGRRFPRLAKLGAELDVACIAPRRDLVTATAWCCAARTVQVFMYAALLGAIGATVTVRGTLVALGVHLVGAGFGDFIPNQVGILEGAYRIFADAVGLAEDPAKAISIAILARIAQFIIAGFGMVVLAFVPEPWRLPPGNDPVIASLPDDESERSVL